MPSLLLLLLLQIVSKLALSIEVVIRWRPLIKNSPLSISSPRGKENITLLLVLRIKCNLNRARSRTKYIWWKFFERRRVTPHKIRQSYYWQHILTFLVSWSQKRQKEVPSTEPIYTTPFTQNDSMCYIKSTYHKFINVGKIRKLTSSQGKWNFGGNNNGADQKWRHFGFT